MSGGGSVRRSEINTFGGRSPVLSLESSAQAICRSRLRPAIGLTAIWGRAPLASTSQGKLKVAAGSIRQIPLSLSALPNVHECSRQHLTRRRLGSGHGLGRPLRHHLAPHRLPRPAPGR